MPRTFTPETVTVTQVARLIDHSILRPDTTNAQLAAGCELAAQYGVTSVCVRPCDVAAAATHLNGTGVAVGTVVAFPHGAAVTTVKATETRVAIDHGAREVDMVLNIGRLRSGDVEYVEDDIRAVVAAGCTVKVILETAYLTNEEKVTACRTAERAGAVFVKTSTGFAATGATVEDLALMRAAVSPTVGVKASGGIRDLDTLLEMANAGATRIGTSSTASILDDLSTRRATLNL